MSLRVSSVALSRCRGSVSLPPEGEDALRTAGKMPALQFESMHVEEVVKQQE